MRLLLLMSVSGSLLMVFYLIFKMFVRDRVNAKWGYRILKAALFFYLIPIQAAKPKWIKVYHGYFKEENRQVVWLSDDIIQTINGKLPRYSLHYIWQYIYFVAVIIIFTILVYKIVMYVKECHIILKHPAGRNDIGIETDIKRQTDMFGIKRKISSRICSGSSDAFTIGVFRPVIVLDDLSCDGDERELIIRHELLHIKSWDGLIKFLGMVAAAIHFFNPLAHYLFFELSAVSEFACDEKVVSQMNEKEIKKYCHLLFEMAQRKKSLYIINFSKVNKNGVQERIERILNCKERKKGWQIFSGMTLSLMIVLVSSITTFAYEPLSVLNLSDLEKEVEYGHGDVDRNFIVNGYEGSDGYFDMDVRELSFADSDMYFVDEQGNRYDVYENFAKVSCNHTYVAGNYNEHVKSGEGCTVYIYNAERCTKCGEVCVKDLCSETKYIKCPH